LSIIKSLILLTFLITNLPQVKAQEKDELDDILGKDFIVNIEAEINSGASVSTNGNNSVGVNDSFLSMSVTWKDKIRAVVTNKLEHIFKQNSVEFNNDFSIQEFIKEAYIEIRDIKGIPVAVIVGKQPIPFGQNIQAMPIFNNNPLSRLQEIDEVYGLTVELTEGLFGLFDQLEVSAFETNNGDLELGKIDGLSVRLSKTLTENWLLTVSHASLGNSHLDTGKESRTSVGIIGESDSGDLVGWFEGVYFSNNPEYPNSSFALTGGVMYRIHRTTDIVVEYSYVQKAIHDLGIGIKTYLTKNLTLGSEVRLRHHVSQDDTEVVFGINLTYIFSSSGDTYHEDYLFGEKKEDDELDQL